MLRKERQQFTNYLKLYNPNLNTLNLLANRQKSALQHLYHLLHNAGATEEAAALTLASRLFFRNKYPVAAMGQIVVVINASSGNHCKPQAAAG